MLRLPNGTAANCPGRDIRLFAKDRNPAPDERPLSQRARSAKSGGGNGGGPVVSDARERNQILCALPSSTYDRLRPHLEYITVPHGTVVYEPDAEIRYVYFPQSAVFSMVRQLAGRTGVKVGTIGRDGVVGVSVALGAVTSPTRCIAQIAGDARRISTPAFLEALGHAPTSALAGSGTTLDGLCRLYAQALFEQTAQSAACNRIHDLERRCARWLLMTHDRVAGDQLVLTQEFLSYMLGVRRAGVTEACGTLQRSGLIQYRHGRITVVDRDGLANAACECYAVVKAAYGSLLGAAIAQSPCA